MQPAHRLLIALLSACTACAPALQPRPVGGGEDLLSKRTDAPKAASEDAPLTDLRSSDRDSDTENMARISPAAPPAAPPPSPVTMAAPRPESPVAHASFAMAAPRREPPAAPALKAGRHDDNKEYNRFLAFLADNRPLAVYSTDISERLLVRALDHAGHSLPNCPVTIKSTRGEVLAETTTYADGSTQFFPSAADGTPNDNYVAQIKCGGAIRSGQLSRAGLRENEIRFDFARRVPSPMPVDVAIVLDTTGSMQSQINRLKQTLKAIHFQLSSLPTKPDIRFAMVAYRDRGDQYVTQVTPFTADVDAYQSMLQGLFADGGGDEPEDLQAALDVAMHKLAWRSDALRVGFIITDAPPHTNYGQAYNYLEAMKESLRRGIKWVTVGAGGLKLPGEVIYRQIAQYSMGEYVFLTQGGGGDSVGGAGEASHHVGANYSTENLDQAIVRIVRRELSYLTDTPRDFDNTIVATADRAVTKDTVLAPAVGEALRQLADYSALKLGPKTLVAVVPVTCADARQKATAEYLTDQMVLSASRNEFFRVVERDLTALTQEMKLQLSNLFDSSTPAAVGELVGAELLIVSKLVVKDGDAELFAKLIRVKTGEMLSVSKVRVSGGADLNAQ